MSFTFAPPVWLPFRDKAELTRVRQMSREDMLDFKQENPDFSVKIVYDVQSHFVTDLFYRIRQSDKLDKKLTVVLPNPYAAAYINVAEMCNKYGVSCRNLHVFFLNEWADENGRVAPPDWERGLCRSFKTYFLGRLDASLRPADGQIHWFTTENASSYSDMIDECGGGGADVVYYAVSWSGAIASIEPGEFPADNMEDFAKLTSKIVTPPPETIAENSLMGIMGCSGDVAGVPPKAATIGPRDIAHARDRIGLHYRGPLGMGTSWQRQISRMMLFGPVTTAVPGSMVRLYPGICYISEDIAKPITLPADADPLAERRG